MTDRSIRYDSTMYAVVQGVKTSICGCFCARCLAALAAWLAVRLICVRTILFVFFPSLDLVYTDNEPTPGRLTRLY